VVAPFGGLPLPVGRGSRAHGVLPDLIKMIVAFHSHTLTFRGSENALWDYACMNEALLGNRSIVSCRFRPDLETNPVFQKWKSRFPVITYSSRADLQRLLKERGVEVLYMIKAGRYDGFLVPGIFNAVHAMFPTGEFHGDAFAFVSPWVSRVMTGQLDSFVPHWVPRLDFGQNLRPGLGIPERARVFGRHGAKDTFNIPFVQRTVVRHAREFPGDHFLFLNTEPIPGSDHLPNIHYLPATNDATTKAAFLVSCDAMLHARWHGETFGLAVAEFAVLGKPVLTFGGSRERAHLELLGDCGRVYENQSQLGKMLANFQRGPARDCPYGRFAEESTVMDYFQEKFLRTV
jgi:hypothetical protein